VSPEPVNVLLVEDNQDHAELVIRALKNGGELVKQVEWAKDGAQALDFLFRRGPYAEAGTAPRPALILLDLKLPKIDGHEVLRVIKADAQLQTIPVVMLTTSGRDADVAEAYRAGANSYLTKPTRFTDLMERIRLVKQYWIATNSMPADGTSTD
jgi:two-component system, response regulator